MNDKQKTDAKLSVLYELRLMVKNSSKKDHTVEELTKLIDEKAAVILDK